MKLKRLIAGLLMIVMCFTCINLQTVDTEAASNTYWIKVNKQANVATAYQKKDGKWVAVRAMLVSCGGSNTPNGTYNTKAKYRWHTLMGPSYGQYCTRIVNGILFHSVWYYTNGDRKSQAVKEFNKLGSTASHGCVRVSTADAKWIYDNCKVGTKVTIYSSSDPGPLGKPAAYKMPASAGSRNWDPTDVSSSNPYYQSLPVLKQKVSSITYGSSKYSSAKKLVKAEQKNGKSLKSLKTTITKYDSSKKKYVSAKYSVKSPGKYKIKYTATGSAGVYITKTFTFTVKKDVSKPSVSLTKTSDTICKNTTNAAQWLKSAKMKDGTNRLKAAKVYVKKPGSSSYGSAMTYEKAKSYKFSTTGSYKVKYVVSNKNKTSVTTTKTVEITVKAPTITQNTSLPVTVEAGKLEALQSYVTAKDYNGKALAVSIAIKDAEGNAVTEADMRETPGIYDVTYTATGTNNLKVTKTIRFTITESAEAEDATTEVSDTSDVTSTEQVPDAE
ncbi:MAG: L,D-transpeptidase [Lachnospiraceae bacterium]|nr:L,D-transpeptidase [Lachnospiraceae bacterium]